MYKNRNIILLSFATSDLKKHKKICFAGSKFKLLWPNKVITPNELSNYNKEKIENFESGKNVDIATGIGNLYFC